MSNWDLIFAQEHQINKKSTYGTSTPIDTWDKTNDNISTRCLIEVLHKLSKKEDDEFAKLRDEVIKYCLKQY